MSATEKLRELLDERGIKYEKIQGECATKYEIGNVRYRINRVIGGLQIENFDPFTPEQVIAKTVGRETCHDTGDERIFQCSECGFGFSDVYLSDENYLWDDDGELIEPWPPFCPNCGRKVVE